MRLSDLDTELMVALVKTLRAQVQNANVFILTEDEATKDDASLFVSGGKLVELRNPLPDGSLRPPLLLIIPFGLHVTREDSFGVATFEELTVTDVYAELVRDQLQHVPLSLQGHVRDILSQLEEKGWSWADDVAQARYLLTAAVNSVDGESLGAALYELGLVPDFGLFSDPSAVHARVNRNLKAVQTITDSELSLHGRLLQLGLRDKDLQRRLAQLLQDTGMELPTKWARRIVSESQFWDLSFDNWGFQDTDILDKIKIHNVEIDAPIVPESEDRGRLLGLIGQQALSPKTRQALKVSFQVEPHPTNTRGLHHFSIQIIAAEAGPVGSATTAKAWKSASLKKTVTLRNLNRVDFEEGWHFVRVLAWTEDTEPILTEGSRRDGTDRPSYESELFYVILDEEVVDEEPEQPAIPRYPSLTHAKFRLQFSAVQNQREPGDVTSNYLNWADQSNSRSGEIRLLAKFPRYGSVHIPVPAVLRQVERHLLSTTAHPSSWRLEIRNGHAHLPPVQIGLEWPDSAAATSFVACRAEYFAAICGEDGNLVTQAADLTSLPGLSAAYGQAYLDLLHDLSQQIRKSAGIEQHELTVALRSALALDTVHILITDYGGHLREVVLLSPLHPLRALWFAVWAQLGEYWLSRLAAGPKDYIGPTRDALLEDVLPLNIPAFMPLPDGRVFTHIDSIHPLWALYSPSTERDARGLLSLVCSGLGVPEPKIGGTAVTGAAIASRMERYLLQHPYIQTLEINVFNPGRSTALSDALLTLQKQPAFADLRYDIRFFLTNPEMADAGDAIEQLVSPEATSSVEVDAFSTPTNSHLFPKLAFALHSVEDFRTNPDEYRAHLTMLFDLFPAEEVGISHVPSQPAVSSLHGLIQEFATEFQDDDESGTVWRHQPVYGRISALPNGHELVDLLASLPALMNEAVATVAVGSPVIDQYPTITVDLNAEQRELIHSVHQYSDWVFTVDRNIGIEFYDHGRRVERPDYVIDYVPGADHQVGYRFIMTSRSQTELEAMLQPVLSRYGLAASGNHAAAIVEQLRALSGGLSLKLLSSQTHQAEALGLALARLFLNYQGVLRNQIVVPLDDHLGLFSAARRYATEAGHETVSLQRTDLALFDLDTSRRLITCNLVEVKCYTSVGDLGALVQLKESIAAQINRSERVLNEHFNPTLNEPDRPDRFVKTYELRRILQFYLERSMRYGDMDPTAYEEAKLMLLTLEHGYELRITRSALIFDFAKPGTELPDNDYGIEFHRIGIDLIGSLIAGAKPESTDEAEATKADVPRLSSAAFIVPERPRIASVESLQKEDGIDDFRPLPLTNATRTSDQSALVKGDSVPPEIEPHADTAGEVKGEAADAPERNGLSEEKPLYDIVLGIGHEVTPQYGLLGEVAGRKVALDLNQTHTISLFGVQGSGKSYTLGSIIEMASLSIQNINVLPHPLATVVFHYSQSQVYRPEFASMVSPNAEGSQIEALATKYGAQPAALSNVALLVPHSKLEIRQKEYPDFTVIPIEFSASELHAKHWKFLMSAVGSQSMYLRQLNLILKRLPPEQLTLGILRAEVEKSYLPEHLKSLALMRLQFAEEYIQHDAGGIGRVISPGRLVIVDLRDETTEKDEALGLFGVMLQLFSEVVPEHEPFNKLVVFDEAHKYMENTDLIMGLVEEVREMRHKGTSVLVASQDPKSVPVSLIELSSQIILHRFHSPAWLKHIQKANIALDALTPESIGSLTAGEAYVWSSKASDDAFSRGAVKIRMRPRVTSHGGGTRTAT